MQCAIVRKTPIVQKGLRPRWKKQAVRHRGMQAALKCLRIGYNG
jgi:hypothetical protein